MSNETLRVRVWLAGDTVLMRVLAMPHRFRDNFNFTASNGLEVDSEDQPSLTIDAYSTVNLRGDEQRCDNNIVGEDFASRTEAAEQYDMIIVAIREANAEMERIVREEPEGSEEASEPLGDAIPFTKSDLI